MLILTIQVWMGPSHNWDGINWVDAWHSVMTLNGWVLVLCGAGIELFSFSPRLPENKYLQREPS